MKQPLQITLIDRQVTQNEINAFVQQLRRPNDEKSLHRFLGLQDYERADLTKIRFKIATNLSGADFSGSNCTGINFASAICTGTNFSYCRLAETDFSFATLKNANFTHASISAKFFKSDLTYTNFFGAKVHYADFSQAICKGSNFIGAHGISKSKDILPIYASTTEGAIYTIKNLLNAMKNNALPVEYSYQIVKSLLEAEPDFKIRDPKSFNQCVRHIRNLPINEQPEELQKYNGFASKTQLLLHGTRDDTSLFFFLPKDVVFIIARAFAFIQRVGNPIALEILHKFSESYSPKILENQAIIRIKEKEKQPSIKQEKKPKKVHKDENDWGIALAAQIRKEEKEERNKNIIEIKEKSPTKKEPKKEWGNFFDVMKTLQEEEKKPSETIKPEKEREDTKDHDATQRKTHKKERKKEGKTKHKSKKDRILPEKKERAGNDDWGFDLVKEIQKEEAAEKNKILRIQEEKGYKIIFETNEKEQEILSREYRSESGSRGETCWEADIKGGKRKSGSYPGK